MPFFQGTVGTQKTRINFGVVVKSVVVINDNETGSNLELFLTEGNESKFFELKPGEYVLLEKDLESIWIKGESGNVNYRVMGI